MAVKLTWCDTDTLNKGGVASAMIFNNGIMTRLQVKLDNGIIRQVVKNANLNQYNHVYLQGGNDSINLSKKDSIEVMKNGGGEVIINCKYTDNDGIQHDRPIKVRFTFNDKLGLPTNDPRAYDNEILSDAGGGYLEGEYTL